ncbi:MAG: PilW family protein [Burkholderiales bacterium]
MRSRQQGMSLVEVLVAVAIGLIGILIITEAYLTSDSFNRSTLGEGGAQTNGTIALFSVERDVRQAGYGLADSRALGCGVLNYYVDPNYSTNLGGTLPNIGFAPVSITTTPGQPDQITVMYASGATRVVPVSLTVASAANSFTVDGTYGFNVNDLMLAVNLTAPANCSLFKLTNVVASSAQLMHDPGSAGEYNPPGGSGLFPAYGKDDLVFDLGQLRRRTFSIVNGNLRATDSLLNDGTTSALDMVDGIVDMRAQYGKDNGINNGTVSNASYVLGDGIVDSFDTTPPVTSSDWTQVLAVRVGILARIGNYEKPSVPGGNCDATTVLPTWSGSASGGPFNAVDIATVTSQDRCFRYRVFETVIPLRNMIWRAS